MHQIVAIGYGEDDRRVQSTRSFKRLVWPALPERDSDPILFEHCKNH